VLIRAPERHSPEPSSRASAEIGLEIGCQGKEKKKDGFPSKKEMEGK
jgi:hypothetical protein